MSSEELIEDPVVPPEHTDMLGRDSLLHLVSTERHIRSYIYSNRVGNSCIASSKLQAINDVFRDHILTSSFTQPDLRDGLANRRWLHYIS